MKCPHCKKEINLREARLRSTSENKYYWGVVLDILSNELGYTKEEMHSVLKNLFLKELIHIKGKEFESVKSTAELTTTEFEEYLSDIRVFASKDFSIWIPEPNEE